jgi:hypothetical protein
MYLFNQINSSQQKKRERDPTFEPVRTVDYYNKLKANCVSGNEFYKISQRLGFSEYLRIGRDVTKANHEDKCYSDNFEAFIGCFEILADRYLGGHYSHNYVSNFVNYIYNSKKINYHPNEVYEDISLLKETNDSLRTKYNIEYQIKPSDSGTALYFFDLNVNPQRQLHPKNIISSVYVNMNVPKENKLENQRLSRQALDYLKLKASGFVSPNASPDKDRKLLPSDIKLPPTIEELGIEELINME